MRRTHSSSRREAAESPEHYKIVMIEDYLELVRDEDDQELKLLERMYPFFTGEFNHHEIMMISNCSRVRIDKMLDKHSAVLDKFWFI